MYSKPESLQGTIGKSFLGLSRYSHHSNLLMALGILPIEESLKSMSVSLMFIFYVKVYVNRKIRRLTARRIV